MKAFIVAAIFAAAPAVAQEEPMTVMPICRDGAVAGVRIIIRAPMVLAPQIVDLVPPPSLCKGGDA